MAKEIMEFLVSISWQLTTIFAVIYLRKDLIKLLSRLKEAKLPGKTELKFSYLNDEPEKSIEPIIQNTKVDGSWNNIGNIYWVASDISWTWEAIVLGRNKSRITHGLNQTLHHIKELNLADKRFQQMVEKLIGKINESLESDLSQENRNIIAKDIHFIRMELGYYMSAAQKNFKGYPDK